MKSWTKFIAAMVVVGFVSAGFAADDKPAVDQAAKKAAKAGDKVAKAPKAKALKGKLVKVDGSNLVVAVGKKGEEAKEITIATDANTKVSIDGKEAKLADIPAGAVIGVMPDTGVAEKIIVTTANAKPKNKPAAEKAAK